MIGHFIKNIDFMQDSGGANFKNGETQMNIPFWRKQNPLGYFSPQPPRGVFTPLCVIKPKRLE
jgi:hypothetical protein